MVKIKVVVEGSVVDDVELIREWWISMEILKWSDIEWPNIEILKLPDIEIPNMENLKWPDMEILKWPNVSQRLPGYKLTSLTHGYEWG